jgi:hypothetical protein
MFVVGFSTGMIRDAYWLMLWRVSKQQLKVNHTPGTRQIVQLASGLPTHSVLESVVEVSRPGIVKW